MIQYEDRRGSSDNKTLLAAIERLSAIKWSGVGKNQTPSDALFFREYMRRAAMFLETQGDVVGGPLFDPDKVAGKHVVLPKTIIGEIKLKLENSVNAYVVFACMSFLKWCVLIDDKDSRVIGFEDLFDPLVRIIERGGDFGIRKGEVEVGGLAIPLKEWRSLVPKEPVDTSRTALREFDRYVESK